MIINQMRNMSNERQDFIRGIIDISHEYITDMENNNEFDSYWLDRSNLVERSFDNDINDEIELLLTDYERVINLYKSTGWFEIESYYLNYDTILWLEHNNINYVAIKQIENKQYYTIFVRHENDIKLYELIYSNNQYAYSTNTRFESRLDDVDDILLTANWHSIKNPITEADHTRFWEYVAETGKQYIDWLDFLNINCYDVWPSKVETNKTFPKIYFKNKRHIDLYKSIFIELKMKKS